MPRLAWAATALGLIAFPTAGQSPHQPGLVLTVFAGVANGHAMWQLPRQTLLFGDSSSHQPDTVALQRRLKRAVALGVVASLFRSSHVGTSVEISFRTMDFDDTCRAVSPLQVGDTRSDSLMRQNDQLCRNITGSTNSGSVLSVMLGLLARAAPERAVSPYARGALSINHTTLSTIALAAPQPADTFGRLETRVVIADDSPRRVSAGILVAGGITVPLSPGYQFRLELRDNMLTWERLDGAANALGAGPRSLRLFHHVGLILGLDVVLEPKRGRPF